METSKLFKESFPARFLDRPNRFLVRCEANGRELTAFLPNPGRLQELLLPGRVVHLIAGRERTVRKTLYTVVAVDRNSHPVMLHTVLNNSVTQYLLRHGMVPGLEHAHLIRSEVRVGRSRFDFLLKQEDQEIILEVKSCTLFGERIAMFPDAVTERGARHLRELSRLAGEGKKTAVLFIVHWPFVRIFMPDYHTDLEFARTLLQVREMVQVIPIAVQWLEDLSLSPDVKLLQTPWDYIEREARDRGTYLLVLELERKTTIRIGSLGPISFEKGFYVYVGSAMNSLSKRMERHRRLRKRHRWHIDDLREKAEFRSLLPIRSSDRLECEVAERLSGIADWTVSRFGSSDCGCPTHLFGFEKDPLHSEDFHSLLQYFRMDRIHESETLIGSRKQATNNE